MGRSHSPEPLLGHLFHRATPNPVFKSSPPWWTGSMDAGKIQEMVPLRWQPAGPQQHPEIPRSAVFLTVCVFSPVQLYNDNSQRAETLTASRTVFLEPNPAPHRGGPPSMMDGWLVSGLTQWLSGRGCYRAGKEGMSP